MEPSDYCIITTTTGTQENADSITRSLLQKHLAACIQASTIQSTFRWQGEITVSQEILLQMKTKRSLFARIKQEIEALHTYEVPEIIMVPLQGGNTSYFEWIENETRGEH